MGAATAIANGLSEVTGTEPKLGVVPCSRIAWWSTGDGCHVVDFMVSKCIAKTLAVAWAMQSETTVLICNCRHTMAELVQSRPICQYCHRLHTGNCA